MECPITFGLFDRRHHCRKCGNIFCSAHCSNYFRLDQFAQFHPKGTLSRGCDNCASDYIQWQEELRQMERAGGGKENLSRRRKSTVAAAAATAATAQAQATSSENKTSSSLKKRHAGIMTQQPQAMEGVTELGRDGK